LLATFPLNNNGKVARSKLKSPVSSDFIQFERVSEEFESAKTPLQLILAEVFCEILNIENVENLSINNNLFRLGGNSLTTMLLLGRLRLKFQGSDQYNPIVNKITIQVIFKHCSVATLEEFILNSLKNDEKSEKTYFTDLIPHNPSLTIGPASSAQFRIYVHENIYNQHINDNPTAAASLLYNVPFAYELLVNNNEILDLALLEQCIKLLIDRFSSLRSYYSWQNQSKQLIQHIIPIDQIGFVLQSNLNCVDETELWEEIFELAQQQFYLNYNHDKSHYEPLLKSKLLAIPNRDTTHRNSSNSKLNLGCYSKILLAYNIHHIAFDGYSIDIFNDQLLQLYHNNGNIRALTPLSCSYLDYSIYEHNQIENKNWEMAIDYWLNHIQPLFASNGAKATKLIEYDQIVHDEEEDKKTADSLKPLEISIDSIVFERMNILCSKANLSLFQLFLSLYILLLHKVTDSHLISIGVAYSNRYKPELEGLCGPLVNTLPFLVDFSLFDKNCSLLNYFSHNQATLLQHMNYSFIPSNIIQTHFNSKKQFSDQHDIPSTLLFQTSINWVNYDTHKENEHKSLFRFTQYRNDDAYATIIPTKFDYDFMPIIGKNNTCKVTFQYNPKKYNYNTINGLCNRFIVLLNYLFSENYNSLINDHLIVNTIPIPLLPNETAIINSISNNTNQSILDKINDSNIPNEFQSSVNRFPNKLAVQLDSQSLTYSDLHVRVCNLAEYLLNHMKIQPGQYIAQCVERSIEMVIGQPKSIN
jgi:hypothetical protein